MKELSLPSFPSMVVLIAGCLLCSACSTQDQAAWQPIEGYWEGAFMPESGQNLTLVLHFYHDAEAQPRARVLLWQDGTHIQDDPLVNITLQGEALSFYIEAKDTPFEGTVHADSLSIRGRFLFPDGSAHPVLVRKVERPSLGGFREVTTRDPSAVLLQTFTPAQLREDLSFLRRELERNHPRPYLFTSKDALDDAFDHVRRGLDAPMTEDAFFRRIAPVIAQVRCAHTGIRLSERFSGALEQYGSYLPFLIRVLDGQLYVLRSLSASAPVVPGSEVRSINGVPSAEVLARLLSSLPADGFNETYKIFQINDHFSQAYATYIGRPDHFALELLAPDGRRYRVAATGTSFRQTAAGYASLQPEKPQDGALPMAFRFMEERDAGVLTVSAFWAPDPERYRAYLAGVFESVEREGLEHLVLDLRGNSGGYPLLAAALLSYIADSAYVYFARSEDAPVAFPRLYQPQSPGTTRFRGNVYVLTDGACISSAAHFIALVRYHRWGTLIGEETGGSFYCHDNSIQVRLPNTGLRVNLPRTIYRTAVSGFAEGEGIKPDHVVKPTLRDAMNGVDAAMAYTLRLIHS